MLHRIAVVWSLFLVLALYATPGTSDESRPRKYSKQQIAQMAGNPLSYLWMLAIQNDTYWLDGSIEGVDKIHANVTTIMPIMPMQLTENYKLIFRPWIPIVSIDKPRDRDDIRLIDSQGEWSLENTDAVLDTSWGNGIGDVGFWAAVTTNEASTPPFVWGAGITARFDTASRDEFGSGRYSAGPMGLAFYVGKKWNFGGILQHWWDYAGDSKRDHVNLTNFQYAVEYKGSRRVRIGATPNIVYDWESDTYDFPVGIGASTLVKIGRLPVSLGFEVDRHWSNNDLIHNKWQLRITIVPVLPAPDWSRKPLF
jgi:hypothetical protein